MLKLIKHLRGSVWIIGLIVALLIVQAYADLSLPSYTADIVNIGIQQGGIAEVAPNEIRKETIESLSLFMLDGQKEQALSYYSENEAGNYALVAKDRQALDTLADIFALPMTIANLFGQSGEVSPERLLQIRESGLLTEQQVARLQEIMGAGQTANLTPEQMQQLMQARQSGGAITPSREQALAIREFAEEFLSGGMELMLSQMALAFVKQEYIAIGVNLERLQTNYLLLTGAKMLGMTLLMITAAITVGFLASQTAAGVGRNLRGSIFKRVVSFSSGDIEPFSTASLITRSTNDVQQVQMATVMLLRIALYAPILGIGGVFRVIGTQTGMGWIIFAAVGLLLVIVGTLMVVAMPKFNSMQGLIDRINLVAREILTGLPVIRAFSRETYENKRFEVASTNLMKTQRFTNRTMTFMMPLMMLIMNGISLTIIWFGGKGMDAGALQVGDMMAFITYTMQIVMSFLMLTMLSVFIPRGIVSAGRIEEVLRTEPSIRDGEALLHEGNEGWKGVVSFRDVSFRYPNAEKEMLSHISFTAQPGQTTAIIGSTGSGKSTALNLIPRFYDVTEGSITIDGVDIRELSQRRLRSLLGYVPQKGVLFSGTIASNIKFGGDFITDEDMAEAADIAQAKAFIGEKAEGYGDPIAQGGTNVSGGQKQRLSIARALAKRPKVLLFDDSFSALDYKTDVTLRRALNEKTHDATVIIVAQRISTVLHAEQIVVLEEGRVAGIGTHEELMQSCAQYQEIAKSQLSEAELMGGHSA